MLRAGVLPETVRGCVQKQCDDNRIASCSPLRRSILRTSSSEVSAHVEQAPAHESAAEHQRQTSADLVDEEEAEDQCWQHNISKLAVMLFFDENILQTNLTVP